MELSRTFRVAFLVTVYLSVLATADIDEIKRDAIYTLESHMRQVTRYYEKVTEIIEADWNLELIYHSHRVLGYGLNEDSVLEIENFAKAAYLMAQIKGSSNDVVKCIQIREKEGLKTFDEYYFKNFTLPTEDYHVKYDLKQKKIVFDWRNECSMAMHENSLLYESSVRDIKKATNESTIYSIVENFDESLRQILNLIVSIEQRLNKIQVEYLKILNPLFFNFKSFAIKKVEEISTAIDKCFPKFYRQEIFFNPNLFK